MKFRVGSVHSFAIRHLDPRDRNTLAALFASEPNYAELVRDGTLAPSEADSIFTELPPGKTVSDKLLFGVVDRDGLIAVLDVIRSYQNADSWFLGLVFVAPAARGKGLGTELLQALNDYAAEAGANALQLAVTVANPNARKLYMRLGFRVIREHERTEQYGRVTRLEFMELSLKPGYSACT